MPVSHGFTLCSFFEEVSARDMEVILNRHAKMEDIDGSSADGAASLPQAKSAKTKCAQSQCLCAIVTLPRGLHHSCFVRVCC